VISRYFTQDSGKIFINERDVSNNSSHQMAAMVAKVLQDPRIATIDNMTIGENLSFAYMRGKARRLKLHTNPKRTELFKEKLALLNMGLENRLDELTGNLSGGQRQALSLIMAVLVDSEVLLLDEITAALDPKMAALIMELTAKIVAEEQRTTLMITHNMADALKYGDRTLLLAGGRIIKEYSKSERSKLTPSELAAAFGEI
jgi:putative ABC transport system ATP-binding protein